MSGYIPSWEHYGTHDDSAYPELWDGCIGAWAPCLGPTGGMLFDTAIRYSSTVVNSGLVSRVRQFDGAYALDCDAGASTGILTTCNSDATASGFSFSCWARPTSFAAYRTVFGTAVPAYDSGGFNVDFTITTGVVRFLHQNMLLMCSGGSPALNSWAHITATYRPGRQVIYLNGVQVASGTSIFSRTTAPLYLGSFGNGSGSYAMHGQLDDMRVYSRELWSEEAALLASGRGIAYTPARPRRFYSFASGFLAAWARNNSAGSLIGGGLR